MLKPKKTKNLNVFKTYFLFSTQNTPSAFGRFGELHGKPRIEVEKPNS